MFWALVALASEPPEGFDAVTRALSNRHAVPCEAVEALTPDPVAALRKVVDEVENPPWSGMRAAECLTRRHAEAAKPDLLRWVSEPGWIGLGRQTLGLFAELPTPVAVEVGARALQGPLAEKAKTVFDADSRPEIRALVAPAVTQ